MLNKKVGSSFNKSLSLGDKGSDKTKSNIWIYKLFKNC